MHSLPILNKMNLKIDGMADFKVSEGFSAETSGGILCMIPEARAKDFMQAHLDEFGQETWVVGEVVKGTRTARINEDVEII